MPRRDAHEPDEEVHTVVKNAKCRQIAARIREMSKIYSLGH